MIWTLEIAPVAEVQSAEVMKKVTGQQDHTCRIGHENIVIEKGKDCSIPENAAFILSKQGIVIIR